MTRPQKFLSPDELSKLTDMAARGLSDAEIAFGLDLTVADLRRHLRADPKAAAALREGRAESEGRLLAVVRRAAESGDVAAAQFLLSRYARPEPRHYEGVAE